MKIASFNVNSIRARLPIVIDWLRKESPDVLCVQELKCQDQDFPQKAFQDINYNMAFKGEKSYNGVAIFSKPPIENVRIGFDKKETYGPRLITAAINNIPIINTYVPLTRAKDELYLCYPIMDNRWYDGAIVKRPSIFIQELQEDSYEKWEIEE